MAAEPIITNERIDDIPVLLKKTRRGKKRLTSYDEWESAVSGIIRGYFKSGGYRKKAHKV